MYSILAANIAIFVSYFFGPIDESFVYDNFALHSDLVSQGQQLWTLISHMYMHGDVMHIVGNMYFLYIIGDNLEDVLGRSQFVLIYTRDHWKCLFQSLGRIRVQGMIFN